jgi:hypothetical protein
MLVFEKDLWRVLYPLAIGFLFGDYDVRNDPSTLAASYLGRDFVTDLDGLSGFINNIFRGHECEVLVMG